MFKTKIKYGLYYIHIHTFKMPITWIPLRGQGHWFKGKLVGKGQYINENTCIMEKGVFNSNGNLNDNNGEIIDYSDNANVSIRRGVYNDGHENGTITEYVFSKATWGDFLDNSAINSTRYIHTFNNGSWQSTSETKNNISILGNFSKSGDKWTSFGFEED